MKVTLIPTTLTAAALLLRITYKLHHKNQRRNSVGVLEIRRVVLSTSITSPSEYSFILEMKSDIADGIPCMHSKKKKNIGCITDFCVSRWGQKGRRGSTSPRRSKEKRGKYTCYVERALPLAITRHNHDEVERERERDAVRAALPKEKKTSIFRSLSLPLNNSNGKWCIVRERRRKKRIWQQPTNIRVITGKTPFA